MTSCLSVFLPGDVGRRHRPMGSEGGASRNVSRLCSSHVFFFFFIRFLSASSHESPHWILHLHLVLTSASSAVTSTTAMSFLAVSIKLRFRLFPFPLSWQFHPQYYTPNIPIIFPPNMFKPHQSCFSCILLKPSHLSCPSDVLLPDLVTPN